MAEPTEAFGDIGWGRTGGTPDVIAKIAILRDRSLGSYFVHTFFQLVGELPTRQIFEVTNTHAAGSARFVPRRRKTTHQPAAPPAAPRTKHRAAAPRSSTTHQA